MREITGSQSPLSLTKATWRLDTARTVLNSHRLWCHIADSPRTSTQAPNLGYRTAP